MLHRGRSLLNIPHRHKEAGYVLALALLISFTITAIAVSLAAVAASKYTKTKRDSYVSTASYVAEAGISQTLAKMYDDTSMTGTGYGAETTFFTNDDTGRGTYAIKVESGPSPTSRYISAVGKIYNPSTETTPIATQYVRVVANLNTSSTNYSVFAGPGGIQMDSGARLQAFGIYSGGKIALNGSSTQIGDPTNPSKIDVANVACRESSSTSRFPYPCTYTDPPLNLSSNSIYGQVCANSQVGNAGIYSSGTEAYGLIPSCAPLRNTVNKLNRVEIMSGTAGTYAASAGNCSNTSRAPLSGTYSGNITISNCVYVLPQIMYIRGDLTITNGSLVQAADANAEKGSLIMATGNITINGSTVGTNSAKANTRFISFQSADSSGCSAQNSCVAFPETTAGWANVQNSLAVNGIVVTNNTNAFGGEFTSYFGNVAVTGSAGSANIVHSLAGQKLTIGSGVTLASSSTKSVSDLVQNRWVLTNYTRTFAP